MPEQNTNLGFQYQDCLKLEQNYTHVTYHNVCTGEEYIVPMGVGDYVLIIPVTFIAVAVTVFAIWGIIKLIKN